MSALKKATHSKAKPRQSIAWGLVTVTEICNNECGFCDLGPSVKSSAHRPFIQMQHQLGLMRDEGITKIAFTGGEPTLHPNMNALVKFAHDIGFTTIRMYSHGRSLAKNNSLKKLIDNGLSDIMISLFGPTAQSHDKTSTIKNSFKQTISGIECAAQSGINLVVNVPVSINNYNLLGLYLDVLDEVASPATILQFSDLYPTTKVLREPGIHACYEEMIPHLHQTLTQATIRGRKFLLQEFPLCTLFPWHVDSKELGEAARVKFHVADKKKPEGLWIGLPWVAPERFYSSRCDGCVYKEGACLGIPTSYTDVYESLDFIKPI